MSAGTKTKDSKSQKSPSLVLAKVNSAQLRKSVPNFRPGDAVKVHTRIIEGNKERIQIFEGIVTKRHKGVLPGATFTVRKVSYNVGVERTFFLHSPRVEKIEVLNKGEVRRARLFYLRDLRGRAARIKSQLVDGVDATETPEGAEAPASDETPEDEKREGMDAQAQPAQ